MMGAVEEDDDGSCRGPRRIGGQEDWKRRGRMEDAKQREIRRV